MPPELNRAEANQFPRRQSHSVHFPLGRSILGQRWHGRSVPRWCLRWEANFSLKLDTKLPFHRASWGGRRSSLWALQDCIWPHGVYFCRRGCAWNQLLGRLHGVFGRLNALNYRLVWVRDRNFVRRDWVGRARSDPPWVFSIRPWVKSWLLQVSGLHRQD